MKSYVCHIGKKQPKIDAKRTIPLMQHVIINQMLTSVTKENQHSNKNWSRKKCIDQFFVAILAANSLEVIDSCILYIPNSNAPISYIYTLSFPYSWRSKYIQGISNLSVYLNEVWRIWNCCLLISLTKGAFNSVLQLLRCHKYKRCLRLNT